MSSSAAISGFSIKYRLQISLPTLFRMSGTSRISAWLFRFDCVLADSLRSLAFCMASVRASEGSGDTSVVMIGSHT
ncbi:hypothetical protein D3C81_1841460 [compost metagenome]